MVLAGNKGLQCTCKDMSYMLCGTVNAAGSKETLQMACTRIPYDPENTHAVRGRQLDAAHQS